MRLYVKEIADDSKSLIQNLIPHLLDLAEDHTNTIMPGYTHLQRAQPITFSHHLMAYWIILRALQALENERGVNPRICGTKGPMTLFKSYI